MLLLRDNKVINLDVREDTIQNIIIVKSLVKLNERREFPPSYLVQDCVGTLAGHRYGERDGFMYGKRIQSEYEDGSGMDSGLIGSANTKGEFVQSAWEHGYRVYIKKLKKYQWDKDEWIELTRNGPIDIPEGTSLYYTRPQSAPQTEKEVAHEENTAAFRNERMDY